MTGTTQSAHISMAVLRLAFTDQPLLIKRGGEPAAADASDAGHAINDHQRRPHGGDIEPMPGMEELRQPVEIEPPYRRGKGHPHGVGPGLPVAQQRPPRNSLSRAVRPGRRPGYAPARRRRFSCGAGCRKPTPRRSATRTRARPARQRPLASPKVTASQGTASGASTAPIFAPELKSPAASARSLRGNHSATDFDRGRKIPRFAQAQRKPRHAKAEHRARQRVAKSPRRSSRPPPGRSRVSCRCGPRSSPNISNPSA